MPAFSSTKNQLTNILKGSALFALLGPALGACVFIAGISIALIAEGPKDTEAGEVLAFYVLIAGLAYYSAALPAAITGALAGALRNRLASIYARLLVGVFGAAMTVLFNHINLTQSHSRTFLPFRSDSMGFDMVCAAIGFLAALVCIRFCRPRNNQTASPCCGTAKKHKRH